MGDVHEFAYAGLILTGFDQYGTEWTVEKSSGWSDGVSLRVQREARSQQDGEWDTQPLRTAREVTLMGKAMASSHLDLEQSGRAFTGAPLRGFIVGQSDEGELLAACYMSDAPRFEHLSDRIAAWQLTVVAPDPLLYGPDTFDSTGLSGASGTGRVWSRVWPRDWGVPAGQTPGSVAVQNDGTATYWPRIRIDAGDARLDNPVVTLNETGDWVRYRGSLAAGQYLDIDCANRRVLLNGQVSVAPKVSFSGRWLGIPVGGGSLSWAADSNGANALMSVFAREGAWL